MDETRQRQLSSCRIRKTNISKKSLFGLLLAGFALNACPLIALYTNPTNPALYFVNWGDVLFMGYCFTHVGISLLWRSAKQSMVRYGFWRVLMCILFIVITSYLLVAVAFDRAATTAGDTIKLNFIKKIEQNIVTINETRKEFTTREIRSYQPLKIEKQMRYVGEDVRLVCDDTVYFNRKVKFHEKHVIWKHNKMRIDSSSRYHIQTVFEEMPKDDMMKRIAEKLNMDLFVYKIESVLDIYLIEERDFGKYSCHVANQAIRIESHYDKPSREDGKASSEDGKSSQGSKQECPTEQIKETKCPCPLTELLRLVRLNIMILNPISYDWKAEFIVQKISPNRRRVAVPVGSIVSSSASYKHLDDRPIEFDHEINGKPFVDTCSELDQSCSILIYLYWFLLHDGGHFTFVPTFYERLQMVEGIGGTSWQCVCPQTYGVHKFVFYRQFYNTTLKRYETIEIEYPDSIELVPEEPNILNPYYRGSQEAFQLPETSCWGNIGTTICVYFERLLHSIASDFFHREKVVIIFGIMICLSVILSRVILFWITEPCINWILGRNRMITVHAIEGSETLAGLVNTNRGVFKYDVFISCAVKQNDLASDIADYLQARGLRVGLLDIDVLGNEITTQGLSRLIAESWKLLVIVTPEYVNSGLQNKFEIQLVLQRLHDGYINEDNIALISSDSNLVPDYFNIFTIFVWPRGSFADVFEQVGTWIGPTIFPSRLVSSVAIIREYPRLTRTSVLSLSCFCFCSLYLTLMKGSAM